MRYSMRYSISRQPPGLAFVLPVFSIEMCAKPQSVSLE
jgi:hypothetical protein